MPLIYKSRQRKLRSSSRNVLILCLLSSAGNILQVQANPAEILQKTAITANECNLDRRKGDSSTLAVSTNIINTLHLRNFPELKAVPENGSLPGTGSAEPGICGSEK